jgi:hypothetical protein
MKRRAHRRRRTAGRIECGGENGGDPVWVHADGIYKSEIIASNTDLAYRYTGQADGVQLDPSNYEASGELKSLERCHASCVLCIFIQKSGPFSKILLS